MEQNKNFAFNMKEIADDVNKEKAREKAEEIIKAIVDCCSKVAQNGQYEFTLVNRAPFGFLYDSSTEKKFLIPAVKERAKQLGLEFGERRPESFSAPEFYVSFASAKKMEVAETEE